MAYVDPGQRALPPRTLSRYLLRLCPFGIDLQPSFAGTYARLQVIDRLVGLGVQIPDHLFQEAIAEVDALIGLYQDVADVLDAHRARCRGQMSMVICG